jgi:hypothetical protein
MKTESEKEVWSWVLETAQKLESFAMSEIPPFIQEYLAWKYLECSLIVGLWLVSTGLMITCALLLRKYGNHLYDKMGEGLVLPIMFMLAWGAGTVVSLLAVVGPAGKDMIQIKVAPKVYLVEKASELIKK